MDPTSQPDNAPYTVLARRFRPQTFAEVVGQEHVGQALRNAIRSGRIAHAYLFTGARGVGKTSTARIFAKAINCPHAVDGVPCNACDVCESIAAGSDVDVSEIDGASNRGIDDIRTLRSNVNVRSMRSPNKVYIIDEVHMLTKEAFNALLKTLEEPPPNVKFVFCTTEPNKVPDTILSRCQRFDFGLIGSATITARLQQIAAAEGVQVADEAVELVARRGAGSMRDAQSLFDQLLAFGSDSISAEDVHRLLGTAPDERLVELADALLDRDASRALALLAAALEAGVQISSLSDQFLEYLRDLMVVSIGAGAVGLTSVSERTRPDVTRQAQDWKLDNITAAMQILVDTKARMQRVTYGRVLLELAFVRISTLERLESLAALVDQLRSAPASPAPAPPARRPAPASAASPPGSPPAPTSRPATTPGVSAQPVPKTDVPATAAAKKNSSEHSPTAQNDDAGPVEAPVVVPLSDATVAQFWAQLLAQIPDTIGSHLKNVSRLAIFGPNGLEISFPAGYSFSKSYVQRPEALKRLQTLGEQLTGRPMELRIHSEEGIPNQGGAAQASPPKTRTLDAARKDPFVQQVISVFGGKVVEAQVAPAAAQEEG